MAARLAGCFTDGRAPELVEHTVETMPMQRIVGIAPGHEDLVDHDQLRHDPVLATLPASSRRGVPPVPLKTLISLRG